MAGEVLRTRREDRPQGRSAVRLLPAGRAARIDVVDLKLWAGFVVVTQGEHFSPGDDWRARMSRLIDPQLLSVSVERFRFETPPRNQLRGHGLDDKESSAEQRLELYRNELRKLRAEQRDHDQTEREKRDAARAYLDEAIALAHPIAFRLLGLLHHCGPLSLVQMFDAFGATASTFEGVARLHFLGALRFDGGVIVITSLGVQVLEEFGFLDSGRTEGQQEIPGTV
jgi:hypothetical protein